MTTTTRPIRPSGDMLYAFTGVSSRTLVDAFRTLIARRGELQTDLVERLTRYPMETLLGFVLATSAALYLAERGANPKIKTFVDALYYISTALSVGYADIFPVTQAGRAIATLVMTFGPALSGEALDPPGKASAASTRDTEEMIARLDGILEELRKSNASR